MNMKRLLLILLLTVLPLQMSWAAVSNYCQHENGNAAQHFGHHEHKHQASGEIKQGKSKSGINDGDCGYCHLSCVKAASIADFAIAFPNNAIVVEFQPPLYQSPPLRSVAKPDWRSLI